ncbi:sodium/proline symporter PutP [Spirochaeta cellobiosiphila]|uniref:sodium/proline symporter PutP n=1 Tax=Spirochaeta cellobiosiphila TaxID=504483 RepID=UPI000566A95B|nr:sodium/proline symporter PutP [Spirochaeta cellobiosiphila]
MILYYLQFGLYLLLMLVIGYISMNKTRNNRDFIIGGRTLGPFTSAISAGASDMSSWLLLGLPGSVFAGGLKEGVWISLGLLIGAYANWLIVAGRLRSMTGRYGTVTLPSFISKRFDDKLGILKVVSTIVILFFFTLYVASGLKGGTLLFSHTFNASEHLGLIVTTAVVVSYTFLGGYLAVCWTDLIQGLLMLGALIFCALLAYFAIRGQGSQILAASPNAFQFKTSWISGLSLLAWGFGYFGQPHILARFIGIRDVKDVPAARRIGVTWMGVCLVLATVIGIIGIGYNSIHPLPGLNGEAANSERIFLALTSALFHPLFGGFVLAAVLAAVMSTADSQLLVLTSSLTEDIPFIASQSGKKKAMISRFGVVGFALLAFLIAYNDSGSILGMVGYAWGGFGASFGPIIVLSVLWKGTSKWGALAGMIVGAGTIFVVKNFINIPGEYFYELLPGFILAFIVTVLVSLITPKPSSEVLEVFEQSKHEVKKVPLLSK